MKKVIYLLVLCMVLGMAGCGTNQENKEPVSGNVSVETENKENKISANNKENVAKETKHKNSRPYIILIFGICCGIAGKFGYDIYKYKKKRVTNKDEQN